MSHFCVRFLSVMWVFFLRGISFVFFIGFLMRIGSISVWWVYVGLFFLFKFLMRVVLCFSVGYVSVCCSFQFVVGAFLFRVSFCVWCEKFFLFPFFAILFLMIGIGLCGIPWLEFFFLVGFFFCL